MSVHDLTQRFMEALQESEKSGTTDALVALYAPESSSQNLSERVYSGPEGAREFWQTYLKDFQSIRSEFSQVTVGEQAGVMEWSARGQLRGGGDVAYRGVSIIEVEGDRVKAFRTYYDSAAFVRPEAHSD